MKKRLLALAMVLAMASSVVACGGSQPAAGGNAAGGSTEGGAAAATGDINYDTDPNAVQDFITYETQAREVETFNILKSQNATDFYVITNLYDGLCTNDTKGNLIPALAETWGTEDGGENWTFNLRKDAVWCDVHGEVKGNVTAQDFITGLEWVLNAAKNENANTSMPNDMIKGAREYNDMTQALVEEGKTEEALAIPTEDFLAMVGIEAPDDYTVVYHCTAALPYFATVTTYSCLYPAPAAQIEEQGVEGFGAVQPENIWYSGPYLLTYYENQNEKVFEPNPNWYGNADNTRFHSVTVKMVPDGNTAYQLYQTGEIDQIELGESMLTTIMANPDGDEYKMLSEKLPSKYSYQIHFCFDKNNEDGSEDVNWNKAVANEAFRQALYYGWDLTNFYARTNMVNPLKLENNFYTMQGLVNMSDGREYTQVVREKMGLGEYNGETMVRNNPEKAAELVAQAKSELAAQGVTFPVEIDYYIASASQTALDSANVLAKTVTDSFGEDFVKLNICTYVSSLSQEVRNPRLASIYINGWGADYGDPENYLFQETFGDDNAYYSAVYSCINNYFDGAKEAYDPTLIEEYTTFTEMVEAANAIVDDMDARYEAYADAETYMLTHCLGGIPCYYSIVWQETKVNDYSMVNAPYGMQQRRYLNWQTNVNGYTTEEYEAFAAEYNK